MGISSVLVFLAGKISGIKYRPIIGETKRGQSIATIESIRYFGAVRSPIQGKISRFNEVLLSNPALVSESPYENWMAEYQDLKKILLTVFPLDWMRGKSCFQELENSG